MSSQRAWATLLLVLAICVFVFGQGGVEAARAFPKDAVAGDDHLAMYSSVYEKAKLTMECWIGRLTSGPSPSGPGH